MCCKTLWAFTVLVAVVACNAVSAKPSGKLVFVDYGEKERTQVRVDPDTWDKAPSVVRAVQAVAASNRDRIEGLETRVSDLEGDVGSHSERLAGHSFRLDELEGQQPASDPPPSAPTPTTTPPASEPATTLATPPAQTVGGTTIFNTVNPPPPPPAPFESTGGTAAPQVGAPTPPATTQTPPSGGTEPKSAPAQTPAERIAAMWNSIGAAIVLGAVGCGLLILVVWAIRAVVIANNNTEATLKGQRADERRVRNATAVQDSLTGVRGAVASGDPTRYPRERYDGVIRDADGNVVARVDGERTAEDWMAMAAARTAATPAAGAPPPPPTPAGPSAAAIAAANGALTRAGRLSPIPTVARGQETALAVILETLGVDLTADATVDTVLAANPV